MKQCNCNNWRHNIEILKRFISVQSTMAWFIYCPWCGKKLNKVKDEPCNDTGIKPTKWKIITNKEDPNRGWK